MLWREWSLGGVFFSPYLIATVIALLITLLVRMGLQLTPLGRWIWHEALFDSALFVCILSGVIALMSRL